MKYNPDIHHRRSVRFKGYNYSQAGAYFITVCVHNRECIFGKIVNGKMILNEFGDIVAGEWIKSAEIRDEIELDEWVVMPNHFHGIAIIVGVLQRTGRGDRPVAPTSTELQTPITPAGPTKKSIGALMAGFKSAVTKRINKIRKTPGAKLWQRNFYEHIIRNENEINRIRQYIINNPIEWGSDRNNLNSVVREPIQPYGNESWRI
jgi:putative transposase